MIIFVTNRKLCQDDFFQRIEQLAKGKPDAIMLREKDLSLQEYEKIARKTLEICKNYQVPLIINQNISIAAKLHLPIHLSMSNLRTQQKLLKSFKQVGASVHSVAEAEEAAAMGASYIIAGHIFLTDCKKGIPPIGLPFLKEICNAVTIPVFAIGGITKERIKDVVETGATGCCIMSEAMTTKDPTELAVHINKRNSLFT